MPTHTRRQLLTQSTTIVARRSPLLRSSSRPMCRRSGSPSWLASRAHARIPAKKPQTSPKTPRYSNRCCREATTIPGSVIRNFRAALPGFHNLAQSLLHSNKHISFHKIRYCVLCIHFCSYRPRHQPPLLSVSLTICATTAIGPSCLTQILLLLVGLLVVAFFAQLPRCRPFPSLPRFRRLQRPSLIFRQLSSR